MTTKPGANPVTFPWQIRPREPHTHPTLYPIVPTISAHIQPSDVQQRWRALFTAYPTRFENVKKYQAALDYIAPWQIQCVSDMATWSAWRTACHIWNQQHPAVIADLMLQYASPFSQFCHVDVWDGVCYREGYILDTKWCDVLIAYLGPTNEDHHWLDIRCDHLVLPLHTRTFPFYRSENVGTKSFCQGRDKLILFPNHDQMCGLRACARLSGDRTADLCRRGDDRVSNLLCGDRKRSAPRAGLFAEQSARLHGGRRWHRYHTGDKWRRRARIRAYSV